MTAAVINVQFPPIFAGLWRPARFKVYYGGRGSAKSHSVVRYLIVRALREKLLILCAREHQNSIQESVHRLISALIEELGLMKFFKITQTSITSIAGSEFIFKGLSQNIEGIKSTEGVDICFIEEGERVSERSWDVLIPTIRKPNSEIVVVFNPADEMDATYQRFVINTPPDMIREKVNYDQNPWFPDVLRAEMEHCKAVDYEKYLHIWEGQTRTSSDAQIFKGKFVVEPFSSAGVELFRYGADYGFGSDPSAAVRCFVRDRKLYIDREAFAYGLDLKDLPQLFGSLPGVHRNILYCDASRPETTGYLSQAGEHNDYQPLNCQSAPKWSGSIEDGIEFIKSFDKVVIHTRCTNVQYEFRTYAFKIDKNTDAVLPIIVDKNNHTIDALRYALTPIITRRSSVLDHL